MDATGQTVELDVLVTAEMPIPAAYVYRGGGNAALDVARLLRGALIPGGEMLRSPCLAYVIRHPSAGAILVDTGFHPDATGDRRRDFGAAMSLMFRTLEVADTPYVDQLRGLGVEPDEVERVVMTHLHVDHTSGMRLLPKARFVITADEWRGAHRKRAAQFGFIAHHLPPESRVDLVDFERDGEPHGPFERTIDLLGDGSVRLLSTPGHTVGHLSLLLRTADRSVLVVGDAAYTVRSIEEQASPLITTDGDRYAHSLAQLKAFMDQQPDAVVVPSHDPTAWRQLAGSVAAAVDGK
jgi:N-acyl homoserine lactone hydrolase